MDDEDLFELQYGDELDALQDLEDEEYPFELNRKGKKSLNFSTPLSKQLQYSSKQPSVSLLPGESYGENGNHVSDNSYIEESLATPLNNSFTSHVIDSSSVDSRKRSLRESMRSDERHDDDDNEEEPIAELAETRAHGAQKKKLRLVAACVNSAEEGNIVDDDFEISPPPSSARNLSQKLTESMVGKRKIQPHDTQKLLENENEAEIAVRLSSSPARNQLRALSRGNVSRSIPAVDFVAVTTSGGCRVYVTLGSEAALGRRAERHTASLRALQLLGVPLSVLRAQIQEDDQTQKLQASRNLLTHVSEDRILEGRRLWVDEYAPAKYTDLLSDEFTNRTLLRWLKLWDHVVYGTEVKAAAPKTGKPPLKDFKKFESKNKKFAEDLYELDQNNCPKYKIALVSGPPGLGKTTLAHIIARHAGYNVVEMNASDDRTPEVFREKISAATQMRAVLGAERRPNCLVIDEIDGAAQPAINVLLAVLKAAEQTGGGAARGRGRRGQGSALLRPIICICNDLYVPAIRQLRPLAFLVTFYANSSSHRLAARLQEIAKRESLKAELSTLMALCEKADNDIRSCINTLQFVRAQKGELSLQAVHSLSLGQKDVQKTLFNAWQHIFTLPKPKRQRWVNPYDRVESVEQAEKLISIMTQNETSMRARFQSTLQMAFAAGEENKIQQGLFENYLEARVKDPRMDRLLTANDWMCFTDVLHNVIGHTQNYTLAPYLPYLSVTFHLLFASSVPPKIIYPHAPFEVQTRTTAAESLMSTMLLDVAPCVRSALNRGTIVMELLPLLVEVIKPTLRPVNTQLYSSREKADLAQLVRVMIAYNLTYQQERGFDGQYHYRLEPNVEDLVRFTDVKLRQPLTYGAKQLIAREIELEKLRRSNGTDIAKSSAVNPAQPAKANLSKTAVVPNHQRLTLQPKPIETKACVDFFGRKIVKPVPEPRDDAEVSEVKKEVVDGDIWFKFKEGFTNAVRKTVRVHDFM